MYYKAPGKYGCEIPDYYFYAHRSYHKTNFSLRVIIKSLGNPTQIIFINEISLIQVLYILKRNSQYSNFKILGRKWILFSFSKMENAQTKFFAISLHVCWSVEVSQSIGHPRVGVRGSWVLLRAESTVNHWALSEAS